MNAILFHKRVELGAAQPVLAELPLKRLRFELVRGPKMVHKSEPFGVSAKRTGQCVSHGKLPSALRAKENPAAATRAPRHARGICPRASTDRVTSECELDQGTNLRGRIDAASKRDRQVSRTFDVVKAIQPVQVLVGIDVVVCLPA